MPEFWVLGKKILSFDLLSLSFIFSPWVYEWMSKKNPGLQQLCVEMEFVAVKRWKTSSSSPKGSPPPEVALGLPLPAPHVSRSSQRPRVGPALLQGQPRRPPPNPRPRKRPLLKSPRQQQEPQLRLLLQVWSLEGFFSVGFFITLN